MQGRQRLVAAEFPSGEGEVKRSDLSAAFVEFEAVEVVAQHGGDGGGSGEVLLFDAQANEKRQGEDEEMTATHTGIEHRDLPSSARPTREGAGCGNPSLVGIVLNEA